ncbi:MAG: DUF4296 domain-containing protein [Bacteroidales bacterium]|nr:DUF4296 domain-containing protein [Bacteroidales bacterium]
MRIFKVCLFSVAILLLAACNSRPDYVVDEDTMAGLLTDIHMAEGLIELQQKQAKEDPEYGQEVMAAVLSKYNLTKEQYDTSLVWYSQNLTSLIRVYKKVDKNLEKNVGYWSEMADASDLFKGFEEGDSVNLWRLPPHLMLDNRRLTHYRYWPIPADSTFRVGDTIKWTLRVPFRHEGQGVVASLSLIRNAEKNKPSEWVDGASTPLLKQDTTVTLVCVGDSALFDQIMATLHLLKVSGSDSSLIPTPVDEIRMVRIHKK